MTRPELGLLFAMVITAGCGDPVVGGDASTGMDSGPAGDAGSCGSFEICGDHIDQNCDGRDQSCGDNDRDGTQACRAGEDPIGGACDCNDDRADIRPGRGPGVPGANEACDGVDNDCNGRVDEVAACCAGCASLGDARDRADLCTVAGECDCTTDPAMGPCPVGRTCCAGGCVDVTSDVMNCGYCGAQCTVSSDTCAARACRCGAGEPCELANVCSGGACPAP